MAPSICLSINLYPCLPYFFIYTRTPLYMRHIKYKINITFSGCCSFTIRSKQNSPKILKQSLFLKKISKNCQEIYIYTTSVQI